MIKLKKQKKREKFVINLKIFVIKLDNINEIKEFFNK